ncbi:MAG TPA: hypothetical protein VGK26_08940 [Thermoanaerobaculia bacterium]|jgi:hypothetical protein
MNDTGTSETDHRQSVRRRLAGSALIGALIQIMTVPVVCGFNPIGGYLHDVGADLVGDQFVAGLIYFLLATSTWVAIVYAVWTAISRRRQEK